MKDISNASKLPDPIWIDAVTLCADLRAGKISAEDLMKNIYLRINHINPKVNAIVNLLPEEEAIELAKQADEIPLSERGSLHGLPMAMKDSVAVKGFATTIGFLPFA